MMPLVDKLAKSDFWGDFLKANFDGEYVVVEKKIGLDNMKKISKCFDRVNKAGDNQKVLQESLFQLDIVLNSIKKQVK